jgi:GNAT superfamily N-acetyltransferase
MADRSFAAAGITIRPVRRADGAGLAGFYARLSPEARRLRFLSASMPGAPLIATLAGNPGVVAVLNESGPRDGTLVGHASVQPDGRHGAEVAFAVADELRGHGLGRRLVSRALKLARELGADRASATMLVGNVPMRHLLRTAGQPVRGDRMEAGTEEIELDLRLPA